MKYSIIFFIMIIFSFFSCSGTPKSNTISPILPQPEESHNETLISSVPDFEPPPLEESSAEELSKELYMEDSYIIDAFEEEIAGFDVTDESATVFPEQDEIAVTEIEEPEPVIDDKFVTEITSIDEPQVAQVPEVPQQPPIQIQEETPPPVTAEPATPPVQTQSVQSMPQPPAQVQTQPPAQVQAQSPAQTQTQPPVQVQTQPPAQTTRQPLPVQASLPLAPAEERPAAELENVPARTEPLRLDTAKDEPVTPFQTVLVPQNETVNFSRIVHVTVGQIIEIPFRGTGWIYLEEQASRRGIVYDSSRLDTEGLSIIFRVEEAGVYTLKFSRYDYIRDYVLNDYVQVIAEAAPVSDGSGWFNPPVDRGRVVVQPRWPTALEEAEILRGGTGSRPAVETPPANASQGTVSAQDSAVARGAASSQGSAAMQQTTQPPATAFALPQTAAPETESLSGIIETPLPPDVILQRAKDAFDSGNVSSAIALLDQYGKYYPDTDELYWLYGQFYEANSPSRNILLSLDYYRRLVREYPQSSRYNEARGRIAYLERYYINIQ